MDPQNEKLPKGEEPRQARRARRTRVKAPVPVREVNFSPDKVLGAPLEGLGGEDIRAWVDTSPTTTHMDEAPRPPGLSKKTRPRKAAAQRRRPEKRTDMAT